MKLSFLVLLSTISIALALSIGMPSFAAEEPAFRESFIFPIGGAPFLSCHGSTIEALPNGDLIAAWYGGDYEGAKNVAIYAARLPKGSLEWSDLWMIQDTPDLSDGNPVLWLAPDKKTLWLFYVAIMKEGWKDSRAFYKKSTDEGKTWSEPRTLLHPSGSMTRNKPLRLKNGNVLLPMYTDALNSSMFLLSKDDGEHWKQTVPIRAPGGNIQPSAVQLSDGSLLAIMRTWKDDSLAWWARSTDGGRKWSDPYLTDIYNPRSAADMTTLPNGHIALVFNDSPEGRNPLTVAISTDEGKTWPYRRDIAKDDTGAYAYPAVIATPDGMLHITYSHNRDSIKYVEVNEAWILEEH